MPSVSDSAYPRLKNPSIKDLAEIYTPNEAELTFSRERTRQPVQRVALLLRLKTFQKLGYFVRYPEIHGQIVHHIAICAGVSDVPESIAIYDDIDVFRRHTSLVLQFLGVTAYGPAARQVVVDTCRQASLTRDDLPDIINMAIEELIRQRYELPAFSTLLRIARTSRSLANRGYQTQFCESLNEVTRQRLLTVLSRPDNASRGLWDQVKREPKRPTVMQMKDLLHHLRWPLCAIIE